MIRIECENRKPFFKTNAHIRHIFCVSGAFTDVQETDKEVADKEQQFVIHTKCRPTWDLKPQHSSQ